jgi:hypothetical protein
MKTVHMILQGKGGIGKTFVASIMAQYLLSQTDQVVCIDTDPVNASFSDYKAFNARRIQLMKGNEIKPSAFDDMMEMILTEDAHFVVDNGAATFIPLSHYLFENKAVSHIVQNGKQVILHTVITGGPALKDTLNGFAHLAKQMPEEAQFMVWLNEYFGEVEKDGKTFEEMKVYTQNKSQVAGIIRIPQWTQDTYGQDISKMMDLRLTFDEAIHSENFRLMSKQRLTLVQRELYDQQEVVVPC